MLILNSQKQPDGSLQTLLSLSDLPEETAGTQKAIADAKAYEGYWNQVYQLNFTNHSQAAQIMYIGNSDASATLTNDLVQLQKIAQQRVLLHANDALKLSQDNTTTMLVGGVLILLLGLFLMFYIRRIASPKWPRSALKTY